MGLVDGTVRVRQNVDDVLHLSRLDLLRGFKAVSMYVADLSLFSIVSSWWGAEQRRGHGMGIARWHNVPENRGLGGGGGCR